MPRYKSWGLALVLLYLIFEPEFSTLLFGIHQYYVNSLAIMAFFLLSVKRLRIEKRFIKNGIILLECAVYTLLITAMNSNEIRFFQHVYFLIQALALYMINGYIDHVAYNPREEKVKLIRKCVLIETIAVVAMLVVPQVKQLGIDLYYAGKNAEINQFIVSKRIYGVFGDYTFKCQIFCGILAAFFVSWAYIEKNKKDYVYALMALFVGVMNGRTGLLIAGVMIACFLGMQMFYNQRQLTRSIKVLIIVIIGIALISGAVYVSNPSTFKFVINMFRNILGMDTGNDNNLNVLRNSVIWPSGLGLFFGTGEVLYTQGSDIGYCNDVYLVGVVFTVIEYWAMLRILWIKDGSNRMTALNLCLMIALLIANVKGVCMRNGTIVMGILWLRMICESKYDDKKVSPNQLKGR